MHGLWKNGRAEQRAESKPPRDPLDPTEAMNEENDNNAWNAHAGLYGESHKTGERKTRSLWPDLSAEVSSVKLHSKVSHGDTRQWHLEQSASSQRPRPESSYAAYSRGKPSFHENSGRWQEHEALVADRIDGMQRSRHLLHQQQQQQQQQQLQQQQQHRKDFEEKRRRSSRPVRSHTPSLLLQKRDEPWTRLENDEFSSRPYTNGGRTQSTRERAQALVERTTSEDLLAMLNEQRLDNLETKTRLTQEIKAKRDELKRREMELIDHEQALRRQHDLLQKEREENQERQRQLEGERKNLQTKTKHLTREMEAMRKTVSRGEKEKFRAEDKLRQQILEKNQKIGLLERDMDLVRGRLEIADAKVKTASHTEAALRQTNSSIVVELKTAQHEQSKLHKQLERAREREAELEASLSKTREERDRADDRAARATRAADDASRQLATEKLRTAALEDDLRKMQEHTLMSARSGESRKLRLEDQSARGDGEDVTLASTTAIANARGPGRQEYLEMLAEVKRCLEEVQASKQANQVLEQRARRAEAELAALKSGSGDFRQEMDGSSSLSLKESNALTKEAARLRSELEQREKTLTQAEWDRVAAEQEAEQIRSALQEAQSELEATLRQLKDVQQRAMESDEQLEVARDLEADLQQKLEEATFKLDEMEAQQEASREKAASHRADEERLLRDVIGEVTQYLGAAKRLTALLDAFLEGEQPTMDVLLDDVDGDTDAGARFAALSSSERVAVLRELQAELAASRDSVLQVRSRIADNYAENLGSDCNVQ